MSEQQVFAPDFGLVMKAISSSGRPRSRSPIHNKIQLDVDAEDDQDHVGELGHEGKEADAPGLAGGVSNLPWVPTAWRHKDTIPEGPKSYLELHDWVKFILTRFVQRGLASEERLCVAFAALLQLGIVVTTHYSGMGTFEIMCGILLSNLIALGFVAPDAIGFRMHSSSDYEDICQRVLGCHAGQFAPEHIFGDLCLALPPRLVAKWRHQLQTYRRRVDSRAKNPKQRKLLTDSYGKLFLKNALLDMKTHKFSRRTKHWCYKHGKHCPHFPDKIPGQIHVEASGTTCVGFSLMGVLWRWLDDSTIPFLAWICMVRAVLPDIIIHECVPMFDVEVLEQALNDGVEEEGFMYTVQSVCFSPTDQGAPIERRRRYTVCTLNKTMKLNIPYCIRSFSEVTFRRLEMNGSVFFQASDEQLEEAKAAVAGHRGLPLVIDGKPWSWRALLVGGEFRRLQHMVSNGVFANSGGSGFVSLSQNWHRQPLHHDTVPALTRNSRIYRVSENTAEDRPAVGSEYFAMQLLPVFLPEGHVAAQHFSIEHLAQAGALDLGAARRLTGNGMSVLAVGSVFLYVLAVAQTEEL